MVRCGLGVSRGIRGDRIVRRGSLSRGRVASDRRRRRGGVVPHPEGWFTSSGLHALDLGFGPRPPVTPRPHGGTGPLQDGPPQGKDGTRGTLEGVHITHASRAGLVTVVRQGPRIGTTVASTAHQARAHRVGLASAPHRASRSGNAFTSSAVSKARGARRSVGRVPRPVQGLGIAPLGSRAGPLGGDFMRRAQRAPASTPPSSRRNGVSHRIHSPSERGRTPRGETSDTRTWATPPDRSTRTISRRAPARSFVQQRTLLLRRKSSAPSGSKARRPTVASPTVTLSRSPRRARYSSVRRTFVGSRSSAYTWPFGPMRSASWTE